MLCEICSRKIRPEHRVFVLKVAVAEAGDDINYNNVGLVPSGFEDGTKEKLWHYRCAFQMISPMSLLGVVRSDERSDV
jgi:hypothetical protein